MTGYSNLAKKILFHPECQYDKGDISNQCSWFVYCILREIKKNNWTIAENKKMKTMYANALNSATLLRKKFGVYSWGESIFSKDIYKQISLDLNPVRVTVLNPTVKNKNLVYHHSMKKIQKFKESIHKVSAKCLCKALLNLGNKSYMMVNRFGESFLIFPTGNDYYIFDSHTRDFGIFDYNGVIKYIKGRYDDTYNFIIWIVGRMTNNVVSKKNLNEFFY